MKTQENLNSQGKRKLTDTNTEIIWMLKLPDKDFFTSSIKILKQATTNTLKQKEI